MDDNKINTKKLTKSEVVHLMESGVFDMKSATRNFKAQVKMRAEGIEPCWECRMIAQKLGFEV